MAERGATMAPGDAARIPIRIAHLYPDLLNLYGDRGNVLAIVRRLRLRGFPVEVRSVGAGDPFDPQDFDLAFLGGGQDYEQAILMDDLMRNKANAIREGVDAGLVFLCICGGFQLMGKSYRTWEGRELTFLGALDLWTVGGRKRLIGNTAYRSPVLAEAGADPWICGFENHSGRTYLGPGVRPLATVVRGSGNNGEDGTEGAMHRNVFCTYSHGSALPKNPAFADLLLSRAVARRRPDAGPLAPLDDAFEERARSAVFRTLRVERD